jgi:hypothetical protein
MDNVQKYNMTDLLKALNYGARRARCWVNIFPTQSTIELRLLSSKRFNKNVFVTMKFPWVHAMLYKEPWKPFIHSFIRETDVVQVSEEVFRKAFQ